jgi:hypothetical protein
MSRVVLGNLCKSHRPAIMIVCVGGWCGAQKVEGDEAADAGGGWVSSATPRRRGGRCFWPRWSGFVQWPVLCALIEPVIPSPAMAAHRSGWSGCCASNFCRNGSTCRTGGWRRRSTIRWRCGVSRRARSEMHQTKKGIQWYFGVRAHLGVDSRLKADPCGGGDAGQCCRQASAVRSVARQGDPRLGRLAGLLK